MSISQLRALLLKRFHLPKERSIRKALQHFTLAEKVIFYFFVVLFVASSVLLLSQVNKSFLVEVPLRGGSLTEGVIGNPRFINPVLAISEADKNLTSLVYSGLVRVDGDGNIQNDLADKVETSKDGLTYTIHLNDKAKFHDGTQVTTDDVEFTIEKVLDPAIKSPRRGSWEGVAITKTDATQIIFTLKKPYAPFINNLTLGILPKNIWKNVSDTEFPFSEFNSLPVGSGPYKIDTVERNSGGIPNLYSLSPFDTALGGAPYIKSFVFKFYSSEQDLLDAYNNGDVDSLSGISPEETVTLKKAGANVLAVPLSRIFGVFFNQSQSKVLLDKNVRTALSLTAPKEDIVKDVLSGFATPADGPLPPGLFSWSSARDDRSYADRLTAAQTLLTKNGWTKNKDGILEKKSKTATMSLSFSISTGDSPELKAVAGKLATAWQAIGAKVNVLSFEAGELNQNVIRPRHYDALLFGEVVGRDADVYSFWHSSQRNDPGLNIALYVSSKVDKLLDSARGATNQNTEESAYKSFDQEIRNDVPAVFLYAPSFIYVIPAKVHAVDLKALSTPQDRFADVRSWYIETNRVWKIFVNN